MPDTVLPAPTTVSGACRSSLKRTCWERRKPVRVHPPRPAQTDNQTMRYTPAALIVCGLSFITAINRAFCQPSEGDKLNTFYGSKTLLPVRNRGSADGCRRFNGNPRLWFT